MDDVIATREVTLYCLRNPENLATWAAMKRDLRLRLNEAKDEVRKAQLAEAKKLRNGARGKSSGNEEYVVSGSTSL